MASIQQRGNTYRIFVSCGRDINGKQIIETTTFNPDEAKTEKQNQKALEKFAFEFEEKVKSGKYLSGEKLTYQDYIKLWLKDYAEKQLQTTTIERCTSSLDNIILPELGHLKLSKILPLHLQTLYNKLLENGYTVNGKHKSYNANTIKRIHQIISSTLNTAVQWQLIDSNPCKRIKPPKVTRNPADIKHFTLEEAQIFLSILNEEYTVAHYGRTKKDGSDSARHVETHTIPTQFKVFFNMALFGGLRLGELIALTWDDIDFKNFSVSITKSTAKTKDGMITKEPKTKSSIRTITLSQNLIQMIKKYRAEQNTLRLSLGSFWKGNNYLFIQSDGSQMHISTPYHVFKKIIDRHNKTAPDNEKLPEITLHGLRHTSATLLIAQNVDVRTVSARLGHSDCSTTMNIYAHSLQALDRQASDKLDILFQNNA